MKNTKVTLVPLTANDREQFILDNQWAFKYGAMMEFGERDAHTLDDGEKVGGLILTIDNETHHNHLDILFVLPEAHSKGIGYGAWQEVEALHPETKVWETYTPYFEKRNIHFYVNKCGFQIDQFWCEYFQPEHVMFEDETHDPDEGPDEMFRFIKVMKP